MTTTCPKTLPRTVLPSLPTVILKLIEATDDEKKSVKELADLASKDPVLCTHILKIANSALINPGQPVKSITQAALNLGISTLRHVAITAGVCQTLSSINVPENFSLSEFWNHSLCCGLLCKELVNLLELSFPQEEAFLAGLLHDIGQLSLVMRWPDVYDKIVQNPRTGQTILESETRICGRDHTVEGYELVEQWRLPLTIRTAVRFHHEDPHELAQATPLLRIVYLSDISAHYLNGKSSSSITEILELFRMLGFQPSEQELQDTFHKVRTMLKNTAQELGLDLGEMEGTPKLKDQPHASSLLRDKSIDLATVVGVLESLLAVRSQKDLHDALFTAFATLTEIQGGLLFQYYNNCLKGVCARGSEDDSLASQIIVVNLKESIWNHAFDSGKPVFSQEYLQKESIHIIDKQIREYLHGDFLAVPLVAGRDKIGGLALKVEKEKWPEIRKGLGLIQLLAREIASVLRGISYRKLWEKEHILNEALVKKCPMGIVITDSSGTISYVNPQGKNLLGLISRLLEEQSISSILGEELNPAAIRFEHKSQIIPIAQKKIELPDGKFVWLDIQVTPLVVGGTERLLFFIRDVTDSVLLESERQKRALWLEKELVKKTQELKRAQEKLILTERMGAASEVARKVVHEVNNPLGIIKNLLKILKIQKETGKIEDKTIDAIGSEIDRVTRIIRKLSDFSRQNRPASISSHAPVAKVDEVLTELEALVGPGLTEKGIGIRKEISGQLPAVAISEDELKQIFLNLLKNAEEAIGEDGEIFIKAYKQDQEVVVEFGDTGPGVREDIEGKIFSPFVTTKGKENSGLGLSVCYGLIKACGGDISLTEREGFGAFFLIRIPVASQRDSGGEGTL